VKKCRRCLARDFYSIAWLTKRVAITSETDWQSKVAMAVNFQMCPVYLVRAEGQTY
jgi:hypothetical protein